MRSLNTLSAEILNALCSGLADTIIGSLVDGLMLLRSGLAFLVINLIFMIPGTVITPCVLSSLAIVEINVSITAVTCVLLRLLEAINFSRSSFLAIGFSETGSGAIGAIGSVTTGSVTTGVTGATGVCSPVGSTIGGASLLMIPTVVAISVLTAASVVEATDSFNSADIFIFSYGKRQRNSNTNYNTQGKYICKAIII